MVKNEDPEKIRKNPEKSRRIPENPEKPDDSEKKVISYSRYTIPSILLKNDKK